MPSYHAPILLSDLLVKVCHGVVAWEKEFSATVDRRAASLALERNPYISSAVRAILEVRQEGPIPDEVSYELEDWKASCRLVGLQRTEAQKQVCEKQPWEGEDGLPPILSLWEIVEAKLSAACTDELDDIAAQYGSFRERLRTYCGLLLTNTVKPNDFSRMIARLDTERLVCSLLSNIWKGFADLAAKLGLPELPEKAAESERAPGDGAKKTEPETPEKDRPDKEGYVESPSDPTAYVLASVIVNKHTPVGMSVSLKNLPRKLADYVATRVRWTRPRDKGGQPIQNRRSVHLADWLQYIEDQKRRTANSGDDGWPAMSEAEVVERTAEVRHAKTRRK